ncbi:MAG TPA: response regulator [Bauldia sp.]|nr:response regulator [Bauldia sp.]
MEKRQNPSGVAVLIVEDEFLLREFAADILADNGFSVFQARDAGQALVVLDEHPEIEILFTDINMPGSMDGLGLAREVARRYPAIHRLITSGRMNISAADALRGGMRFIQKPYMPRDVVQTIREMLAGGEDRSESRGGAPGGSYRSAWPDGHPA